MKTHFKVFRNILAVSFLFSLSAHAQNYNSDTAVYRQFEYEKTMVGDLTRSIYCTDSLNETIPGYADWSGINWVSPTNGIIKKVTIEIGHSVNTGTQYMEQVRLGYTAGNVSQACPTSPITGNWAVPNSIYLGTTSDSGYGLKEVSFNTNIPIVSGGVYGFTTSLGYVVEWDGDTEPDPVDITIAHNVSGHYYAFSSQWSYSSTGASYCDATSSCTNKTSGPWVRINYLETDPNGGLLYPDIRLYGNGQNIIHQDSTPTLNDNTDFGIQMLYGKPTQKSFYIKNEGTDTLKLLGANPVKITGANSCDFYLVNQSINKTILPNDSVEIMIGYSPMSSGLSEAQVEILSDDYSRNPFVFDIKGTVQGFSTVQYNSPYRVFRQFEFQKGGYHNCEIYGLCIDSNGNNYVDMGWDGIDWIPKVSGKIFKLTLEVGSPFPVNNVGSSAELFITDGPCIKACPGLVYPTKPEPLASTSYGLIFTTQSNSREYGLPVSLTFQENDTIGFIISPDNGNFYYTTVSNGSNHSGVEFSQSCDSYIYGTLCNNYAVPWFRIDYIESSCIGSLAYPDIRINGNKSEITHLDSVPNVTDNTSFGVSNINVPISKQFFIKNQGTDTLKLEGSLPVYLKGNDTTDFTIATQPATTSILPGDSTAFSILFNATSIGEKKVKVFVKSNDYSRWPFEFTITGEGALSQGDSSWVWVSGDSIGNGSGYYGAKGLVNSNNLPSSRARAISMQDQNDNLWVFGGEKPNGQTLNDLWKWDGMNWTWVSGDSTQNQSGVYGTKGTPASSNKPGGRKEAVSWSDENNNFYVFGGRGYNHSASNGYLNDFWKWDGTNWTWMSGSTAINQAGNYGSKGVAASANHPGARYRANSWTDAQNNLWLFGGYGYDANGSFGALNDLWKWDGTNWIWISGSNNINQAGNYGQLNTASSSNAPGPRNRPMASVAPNGDTYLFGGSGRDGNGANGNLNDLWKWDGTNWTWIAGDSTRNTPSSYGTKGVPANSNVIGARFSGRSWVDSKSNFWVYGGFGVDSLGTSGHLNDMWKWDGNQWTWISGSPIYNTSGSYSQIGVADTNNSPGGRYASISWQDSTGGFWLFGGLGVDANGGIGKMNDLWYTGVVQGDTNSMCTIASDIILVDTVKECNSLYELKIDSTYSKYLWSNGDTTFSTLISAGGTYFVEVEDANGCTGSDTVVVSLLNPDIQISATSVCFGDSVVLSINAQPTSIFHHSISWSTGDTTNSIKVYPQTTSDYFVVLNDGVNSCSDTVTIIVKPIDTSSIQVSNCGPYIWPANGQTYSSSGLFYETLQSQTGCDSILELELEINQNDSVSQTVTSCGSYTWSANNQTYFTSGVYTITDTNSNGCDSVSILNLTINPGYNFGSTAEACGSYTWPINNQTFTSTGVYYASYQTQQGCDSNYVLSLIINQPKSHSQYASTCNSYTWPLTGQTLTTSGVYTTTLNTNKGCDSIVTLNLSIFKSDTTIQTKTACNSYTWPVNNQTYTTTGTYQVILQNTQGCDSIVVLDLYINTGSPQVINITACNSYYWSVTDSTYAASGNFTETLTDSLGCTFQATLNLTILSSTISTQTVSQCDQYTWPVNGNTYKNSGNYSAVLTGNNGCDSIINLDLTVLNSDSVNVYQSACGSYTWPVNNQSYASSGTYSYATLNSQGCDSTLWLNLTIHNEYTIAESDTACDVYIWSVNDQVYTSTGNYSAVFTSKNGCDSTYTLDLTIQNSKTVYNQQNACNSYLWPVNGQTFTQSGTYHEVFTGINGCDSNVVLDLTINSSDTVLQQASACSSYTWPVNNQTYSTSGQYFTTFSNSAGCDSIVELNLTILPSYSTNQFATACDAYVWPVNGQTYTNSGTYSEVLSSNQNCDSTVTLNLTITNSTSSTQNESACSSYTWPVNGQTYTSTGIYNATFTNSQGCDSTVYLNLTINSSPSVTQYATACNSYTWPVNGVTYTSSGVYSKTFTNALGCDSTHVLDLTINPTFLQSVSATACNVYIWPINNQTYTSSGSYAANFTSAAGCDSVYILNLTIHQDVTTNQTASACNQYTWPVNGQTYTATGSYSEVYTSAKNCDSIVTLNLTINTSDTTTQTETACVNYTWPVNNQTYTITGVYYTTLTNSNGCDSVCKLDLEIVQPNGSNQVSISCDSYMWPVSGLTYSTSGIYSETLQNQFGCDSVVTLDLTINNSKQATISTTACDEYVWPVNGSTYTSSGNYLATVQSALGCDSVITLSLTINNADTTVESVTTCNSYTWPVNNQTYTATGTHQVVFQNNNGCDSIVKLDLVIESSGILNQTIVACDQYTWPVNQQTFFTSGIYTDTILDTSGCSIFATLNLTVNNSSSTSVSMAACNSYTWPVNGNTYTASGQYVETLTNAKGCDSTVTLNLSINQPDTIQQVVGACDNYTWSETGSVYTQSGNYTKQYTNANGCDSVYVLDLTINDSYAISTSETACDSFFWPVNNQTYTQSGTYAANYTSATGCDSNYTLLLQVNPSASSSVTVNSCGSYFWQTTGQNYHTSGVYKDTLFASNGCDSIITLSLNVIHTDTITQNVNACNNYTWTANSQTYTSSGIYFATLTNTSGCDSVVQLSLTINNNYVATKTVNACGSYYWPVTNQTYVTSGNYTATKNVPNDCDSVITLDLTLQSTFNTSIAESSCSAYTWPLNQQVYASSGVYIDTVNAQNGCDSIVTLYLTVSPGDSIYQAVSVCDSFYWPVNQQSYYASGIFTESFTSSAGCDSIHYLDLNVFQGHQNTNTVSACDSYTWSATGQTYNSSGVYQTVLINSQGCDSILTLNLTIHPSKSTALQVTACNSYFWPANGVTYTQSGTYVYNAATSLGCDSTITLQLVVNKTSVLISPSNVTVDIGDPANFFCASNPATASFQWQTDVGFGFQNISNAGQYSGANTNTLTVSNTNMQNNNQQFRCIVSANNCSDTSSNGILTVIDDFAISEVELKRLVKIYPNPTFDLLNIKFPDKLSNQKFQVFDDSGRLVYEGDLLFPKTTIDVSQWKAATYMLKINGTLAHKFRVVK